LLAAIAVARPNSIINDRFSKFVATYQKDYKSVMEYNLRKTIFERNMVNIDMMNRANPGANFGINKFTDLTQEEFSHFYLMPNYQSTRDASVGSVNIPNLNADLPDSFDWRDQTPNPVTAVKDQGQCGSCWAFSATEEVETAWIMAGHSAVILAPQQIVDCDKTSDGCGGGETESAYKYIIKAGGLETEADYPYTAEDGKCEATQPKVASITAWKYATSSKNETELQLSLAQIAPISICVDASSWSSYVSGILSKCGKTLDHCVQLVGWGVENGTPYWTVRNSWGTSWGENGYIRLAMGSNLCGLADDATIVTVG
jgi:C1A family cysteine protease